MNNKDIYCGNCGKKGHIYKKCFMPITSLGIICVQFNGMTINDMLKRNYIKVNTNNIKYRDEITNKLKFLLVRRKHSLGYIEFTRGNYNLSSLSDIDYLRNLFSRMSKDEIEFIKNGDFDNIWYNLWIMKESTMSHVEEYLKSKHKFDSLYKGIEFKNGNIISLKDIINKITPLYDEPEWGFPKGRRNIRENDFNCACREFMEETDFKKHEFNLLELKPLHEIFTGTNQINYKHTYYIAQSFKNEIPTISDNNFQQKIEISDIKWFTYPEAMKKIRGYNAEKKKILTKVYQLLYTYIEYNLAK